MARKKSAMDLIREPLPFQPSGPDPPVSKGLGYLTITQGDALELLTRTNRAVVGAITSGSVFVERYDSPYIRRKIERIERLAISTGGLGRQELIQVVQAGGQMSDAFYENSKNDFVEPVEDD